MDLDLDYKIQYAAEGVAHTNCIECYDYFKINDLVIAKMVQSKFHDGKDPIWYHIKCFFVNHSVSATSEIENFEKIPYNDQLIIISRIDPKAAKKYKNIVQKRENEKENSYKNFVVDYAGTNGEVCSTCHGIIEHREVRIRTIVYNSQKAEKFGKEILWSHMACFAMDRERYNYLWSGKLLEGFGELSPEHQIFVAEWLPALLEAEQEEKKPRLFGPPELNEEDLEEKIVAQTEELLRIRQSLQKCQFEDLEQLLHANDQEIPDDYEVVLDRCADILTFGSLYKCQKCEKGEMIFSKFGYTCNAWLDEWVKCGNFQAKPLRMKCFIPEYLKESEFFATCEPKIEDRAVRPMVTDLDDNSPTPSTSLIKKNHQQKTGTTFDHKSKYHRDFHVYVKDNVVYSCVLGLTDIQKNKNSYYKLKVLQSDSRDSRFALYTSWGRTGTDIGSCNDKDHFSADEAVADFEKIYQQQTGNEWKHRDKFVRIPGKFYPIDVEDEGDIEGNVGIKSQLNPQVMELMKLLFNINNMQITMKQFKLDLQKMPLGKLSAKQLQSAQNTLQAIENAINNKSPRNELIGLSNKFFTLIPHNFGYESAPVIDTMDMVNIKKEMIDSLNDIENAYAMMRNVPSNLMNSFDSYYNQLNARVEPVDPKSETYNLIDSYMQNTSMHGFKLSILDVFEINRFGEAERYAPFEKFPNRLLLWHGSRVTNFASIVKNGLKISPQAHGSMFGRGIYFADMVSKSANYCQAINNVGILALCEVALGNIQELNQAQNVTNLPPQFNSVKGVGMQQPDMNQAHLLPNGVVIPLGKPVNYNQNQIQNSVFGNSIAQINNKMYRKTAVNRMRPAGRVGAIPAIGVVGAGLPFGVAAGGVQAPQIRVAPGLQFNEYIVYNEAQIKLKYLVKFKQN